MNKSEPILTAQGITKSFFGVRVLHGVDLELYPGRIHGLVGENGAGKSTLMKIIAGVYTKDDGELRLDGAPVDFTHPLQAMHAGVATVFQEFNLLAERSVAENVFLGREPRTRGFVNNKEMAARTSQLLDELGIDFIHPGSRVGTLTVAEQQIVEIVKALSFDARVISMDEPTAALSENEVVLLYGIIRKLAARGVAVLYVSHRLAEVFELCETITVLKDGALVSTGSSADLTPGELVRRMVGRSIANYFPDPVQGTVVGDVRVAVRDAGNDYLDGISFELRAGEIVGLAGLQGSGRTELAEALFGAVPFTRGSVQLDGRPVTISSPRAGVRAGLALVTEDRKAHGLALSQSMLDNALLVIRGVFAGRTGDARKRIPGVLSSLEVSARGLDQQVEFLSGGNQQKVVLSKWLVTEPRVVIFDEPTRGIDVGAKVAVYQLMRECAAAGMAILMISSELPEIIGMSDRILAMNDGRLAAELPAGSTEEAILLAATGHEVSA